MNLVGVDASRSTHLIFMSDLVSGRWRACINRIPTVCLCKKYTRKAFPPPLKPQYCSAPSPSRVSDATGVPVVWHQLWLCWGCHAGAWLRWQSQVDPPATWARVRRENLTVDCWMLFDVWVWVPRVTCLHHASPTPCPRQKKISLSWCAWKFHLPPAWQGWC